MAKKRKKDQEKAETFSKDKKEIKPEKVTVQHDALTEDSKKQKTYHDEDEW